MNERKEWLTSSNVVCSATEGPDRLQLVRRQVVFGLQLDGPVKDSILELRRIRRGIWLSEFLTGHGMIEWDEIVRRTVEDINRREVSILYYLEYDGMDDSSGVPEFHA
jgi:hypothetical protein